MSSRDAVVLQVCPDHVSADALAAYLQAESVPAFVHDIVPIPGLEQGTEVLVPEELLPRARELIRQRPPPPSDAELTALATGRQPAPAPERAPARRPGDGSRPKAGSRRRRRTP